MGRIGLVAGSSSEQALFFMSASEVNLAEASLGVWSLAFSLLSTFTGVFDTVMVDLGTACCMPLVGTDKVLVGGSVQGAERNAGVGRAPPSTVSVRVPASPSALVVAEAVRFDSSSFDLVAVLAVLLGLAVAETVTFDVMASGRTVSTLAAANLAAAAAIGPGGLLGADRGAATTVTLLLIGVGNCDMGTIDRLSWTDHFSPSAFSLSANSPLSLCF
jgi:hypothetical protein